jgi:hypothetical protein
LRRQLLQLLQHVPDLQEIWFAFADELPGPLHDALPGRAPWELDQARMELFLWDFFQRISLARPILRIARSLEAEDLRLASRLDDWSLSPWSCYRMEGRDGSAWTLRHLVTDRTVLAHAGFDHHVLEPGDGVVTRLFRHGGHVFTGLAMLRFPTPTGVLQLEQEWRRLCERMGVPASVTLRPDVHNEQWFAFHRDVLELWAGIAPLRRKHGRSRKGAAIESAPQPSQELPDPDQPLAVLGNQSPREASTHAMGRHRLKRWLADLEARGQDASPLRKALKLD